MQKKTNWVQEIETWVHALSLYDQNDFEEAIGAFSAIADTSKIHFNCGVIFATLGEHEKAVGLTVECLNLANRVLDSILHRSAEAGQVLSCCQLPARCLQLPHGRF
jgi:hypothetical protein